MVNRDALSGIYTTCSTFTFQRVGTSVRWLWLEEADVVVG